MREAMLPEDNPVDLVQEALGEYGVEGLRPRRFGRQLPARQREILMAYDKPVAESNVVVDGLQDDATHLEGGELAEYIRAKLNLAIQLACEGERERRSGHCQSAEGCKCRWGEVMAQVKRLLPVLRNRGVSLFLRESVRLRQEQPARSEAEGDGRR